MAVNSRERPTSQSPQRRLVGALLDFGFWAATIALLWAVVSKPPPPTVIVVTRDNRDNGSSCCPKCGVPGEAHTDVEECADALLFFYAGDN